MFEKPALDREFVEEMQTLLEVDELERMAACDIHGAFDHRHGAEGAAKLVDLLVLVYGLGKLWNITQYSSPQYQTSTRKGNFLSSLLKKKSLNRLVFGDTTFVLTPSTHTCLLRHFDSSSERESSDALDEGLERPEPPEDAGDKDRGEARSYGRRCLLL